MLQLPFLGFGSGDGLSVGLRHTLAVRVHHAEVVLGFGVTLLGRLTEPLDSLATLDDESTLQTATPCC